MATLRKDGRWQASYLSPIDGKRKFVYAESEQEAEDLKARALGLRTCSTDSTLDEFVREVWGPTIDATTRPATQRKYATDYKTWIRPILGDLPITQIKAPDCQAVLNQMILAHKEPSTQGHVKALMSTILNAAIAADLIERNHAKSIKVRGARRKRKRVLSVAEALAVLERLRESNVHREVLMAMLFGLRNAEICGLKWIDLDRIGMRLNIQRQAYKASRSPVIAAELKEESSYRTIPLTRALVELIDSIGDLDSEFIAPGDDGNMRNPDVLTSRWRRAPHGLDDFHFHDLRHVAAGLLVHLGTPLPVVQAILGHAAIDMTMLYVDALHDDMRDAVDGLAKRLIPVDESTDDGSEDSTNDVRPDVKPSGNRFKKLARSRGLEPRQADSQVQRMMENVREYLEQDK